MKKHRLVLSMLLMLIWSANAQMVLEFDTNLSDGTHIVLPFQGSVNVTVDWGDGTTNTYTTSGGRGHTYQTEGTYTVSIAGKLSSFGFNPTNIMLVKVKNFGDLGLTSFGDFFVNAANLIEVPPNLPPTITSTRLMFYGCKSLNSDISNWNVKRVTNMFGMFLKCTSFNQDLSKWDVSNVTNMSSLFGNCVSFNQTISNWNVSKVTDMNGMFSDCSSFNQDISN